MKKLLINSIVPICLIIFLLLLVSACSDAKRKQITSIGSPGKISCYSGGKLIYEGESTGKISTEGNSDGWYFEEKTSGKLIRISGDCVIRN